MLCTDLDRYLEAFVDGRLGRSRTGILRRHLEGCARCRGKVDRLRHFERDVRSRLHAPADARSLWQGLETTVTSSAIRGGGEVLTRSRLLSSGPPRRAPTVGDRSRLPGPTASTAGRRLSQLVGVVVMALACGAVWELARGWMAPLLLAAGVSETITTEPAIAAPEPLQAVAP